MDLNDLKISVSKLSDAELMNLIRNIRTSRRTPKATTTNNKPKVAKASNPVSLDSLAASLSPEQLAQLIETLEAQNGSGT